MKTIFLSNHVQAKQQQFSCKSKKYWWLAVAIAVFSVMLAVKMPTITLLGLGLAFALFVHGKKASEQSHIYAAGADGEIRLQQELGRLLPDDFTGYFNVPMAGGDIDAIVVGPTGVYALEAKNLSGEISCFDGVWSQYKAGRGYKGRMSNPTGQLGRYIKHLRDYLDKNGIRTWVDGHIVFTHPNANLHIRPDADQKIQAITIHELLTVFKRDRPLLEPKKQEKIGQLLMRLQET